MIEVCDCLVLSPGVPIDHPFAVAFKRNGKAVIGEAELDGTTYYAMMPTENANAEEGIIEYVLLKKETDENGEDLFITLDDEDEFEKVAAYFDELFDSEVDYDA